MSFQQKMQQKINTRLQQYQKTNGSYIIDNSKSIKKTSINRSNNKLTEYSDSLYNLFENHQYSSNLNIEGELTCPEIICDRLILKGETGYMSILNDINIKTPIKDVTIKNSTLKSCYIHNPVILGGSLGSSQSINFINSQQLNIQNPNATRSYLQIGGVGRENTISTGYSTLSSSTAEEVDLNLESTQDINLKSKKNINFKSGNNTIASVNLDGIVYQQTTIMNNDEEITLDANKSGSIIILQIENKTIKLPLPKKGVHYKIVVKKNISWNLLCNDGTKNIQHKFLGNIFNFNKTLQVIELLEVNEIFFSQCKSGDKLEIISDGIHWIISGWFNKNIILK
jgi:hypothetical protein